MHAERRVPHASLFRMETTARKYEEFAAECERLAKDAREERHRSVLIEMAAAWRQLAAAGARKKQ
jgi:hypothetical protein